MKLIKLNEDHYVIVDDSEIKEGDWTYHHVKGIYEARVDGAYTNQKKITHSTQLLSEKCKTCTGYCEQCVDGTKSLSLQEVKELIGEVNVEKKVRNEMGIPDYLPINSMSPTMQGSLDFGIKCYTQALEDNKDRKYTEDDISYAIALYLENKSFTEIIQSLQPKTEWEVEFVDGKLKLK